MEDTADKEIVVQPALSAMMVNAIHARLEPLSHQTGEHAKFLDAQIIPEGSRTVNANQITVANIKEMLELTVDTIALGDKFYKVNVLTVQLLNEVLLQTQDIVMPVFHVFKFNVHTIIFSMPKVNVNHVVNANKLTILEDIAHQLHVLELEISCLSPF